MSRTASELRELIRLAKAQHFFKAAAQYQAELNELESEGQQND